MGEGRPPPGNEGDTYVWTNGCAGMGTAALGSGRIAPTQTEFVQWFGGNSRVDCCRLVVLILFYF